MWAVKLKRTVSDDIGNAFISAALICGPYDLEKEALMHATRLELDPINSANNNGFSSVSVEFTVVACHYNEKAILVEGDAPSTG